MNSIKDIVKKDSIFLINHTDIFLYEKLEKVTTAIYMVTEFFPEKEPLKNKIREKGIELMSFIMSFKISKTDNFSYKVILLISEIESLMKIALISKNISEMNYAILSQEYKKITDFVEVKYNQSEQFVLLKDFFRKEDDVDENSKFSNRQNRREISKGHSKGIKDIKQIKDTRSLKQSYNSSKNKNQKKIKTISKAKIDRKELIIKFIKDKKEVSIKDIVKDIKNCSEKTIQRDLINMVKAGVLKKKGERRWSKYLLKK